MARQQGVVVQNNFTGGLNTEFTALKFPENAATETYNCVFDYTGRVIRRKGFDLEPSYVLQESTKASLEAFTEYTWASAGGQGDNTFFIQQKGAIIFFYDITNTVVLGPTKKSFTIDLDSYKVSGSNKNPGINPCQYTLVSGSLIIVNAACDPISVEYSSTTDSINVNTIVVKIRDFKGTEDGMGVFFRPTSTVTALKSDNGKHYYNLLNQGWWVGDALSQWDSALTTLPANSDYIATTRLSDSDAFDVARVTSTSGGNSAAPKGHFIIDVGAVDRSAVMIAEGFTGVDIDETVIQVTQDQGSVIGNFSNEAAAFDNQLTTSYAYSGTSGGYVGKDFSSSVSVKVDKATVYPSSSGLLSLNDVSSVTMQLYGKATGTAANATDGTLLGTTVVSASNVSIDSSTPFTTLTDMSNGLSAFDDTSYTYATKSGSTAYIGKTFSDSSPVQVSSLIVTPGSTGTSPFVDGLPSTATVFLQAYGKNGSAPTSSIDGTFLGSTTRTISTNSLTYSGSSSVGAYYPSSTYTSLYDFSSTSSFGTGVVNTGFTVSIGTLVGTFSGSPTIILRASNSAPISSSNLGITLSTASVSAGNTYTLTGNGGGTAYKYYGLSVGGSGTGGRYVNITSVAMTGTYTLSTWSFSTATITVSNTTRFKHVWVAVSNNAGYTSNIIGGLYIGGTQLSYTTGGVTINSSDTTSTFRNLWIRVTSTSSANEYRLSEIFFDAVYDAVDSTGAVGTDEITTSRFSTVATFAGRVWYGGLNHGANASTIFFSRTLTNKQYGQCYQEQDPTSEYYSILTSSDGGTISIPEIGVVRKLFSIKTALLVFSSNGVWVISGSNGRAFAADDFQVKKVSGLGSSSPLSFVDYKGYPMWFGEDGIYVVIFDPRFETYEVQSISDESIKSFFLSIPSSNRKFVKGTYDLNEDIVTWIYNNNTLAGQTDNYKYNAMLSWSGRNKAFYPWTVDSSSTIDIRGINYIFDRENTDRPVIKYTCTFSKDADEDYLVFSNNDSVDYYDWTRYSQFTTVSTDRKDYESYFITGYRPDGETQRQVQANYLYVFLESDPSSSCKVQSIFDYAANGQSGKFSMFQQAYNTSVLNRYVNYSRLRMRGHGRSLQFKFKSESGKPFTIIGWSIYETGNANV